MHGPQQECIEDELTWATILGERLERPDGQSLQLGGRCTLLAGESFGGLEHRARGGVAPVVGDDGVGEGVQTVHLRDDIEAAARIEMDVDVGERFEASTELGPGAAHPLATARTSPWSAVSNVMIRSASPSLCWRSTTASSR